MTTDGISRRQTLTGAAAVGAIPLLAACGGDGDGATPEKPAAGETLGPTSDVPVGGGKIYKDKSIVVTQPTEGEFKAFSANCTHQGCLVTGVADGTINCTCHGSKFSIEDGSNVRGPSNTEAGSIQPLPPVEINVDGDEITTS